MMDLDEAFRHAADGRAVLFLGAGFSTGAKNAGGEYLPAGAKLSESLMKDLGEDEEVSLSIAAEIYSEKKGDIGLLQFLRQKFEVAEVARYHEIFAGLPWQAVYTTNYDSVFENA